MDLQSCRLLSTTKALLSVLSTQLLVYTVITRKWINRVTQATANYHFWFYGIALTTSWTLTLDAAPIKDKKYQRRKMNGHRRKWDDDRFLKLQRNSVEIKFVIFLHKYVPHRARYRSLFNQQRCHYLYNWAEMGPVFESGRFFSPHQSPIRRSVDKSKPDLWLPFTHLLLLCPEYAFIFVFYCVVSLFYLLRPYSWNLLLPTVGHI